MDSNSNEETRKKADAAKDAHNLEEAISLYLAASLQGDVESFKSLLEISQSHNLGLSQRIVSEVGKIEEADDSEDEIPDFEELPESEFVDMALNNPDGDTCDFTVGLVLKKCIDNGFLPQLVEEMKAKLAAAASTKE